LVGIVFAYQDFLIKEKYLPVSINSFAKNTLVISLVVACLTSIIFFTYRPIQKNIAFNRVANMWVNERPNHYVDLLGGTPMGNQLDASEIAYVISTHYAANVVEIKNDKVFLPYAENDLTALSQYLEEVAKTNNTDSRLYLCLVTSDLTEISLSGKPYDSVVAGHLFDLLGRASKLSPMNPQIYWEKAQVYGWSGDTKNMEKSYEDAIALDPHIPNSYQFLINFAKATGDQKLYSQLLLEAQKEVPGFVLNQ
jgi:tetratricopeptide (TPR) repeat protein